MPNRIPREFITDLLERCDIVDIIHERVPLKKAGANYVACCPFHQEKTPSFSVSPHKQFYHCFSCKVSGNAIGFLMEFERLTFPEAIETLAKSAGVSVPKTYLKDSIKHPHKESGDNLMGRISQYYQQQLHKNTVAQNYLAKRGINQKILETYGIGYAPNHWHDLEALCRHNQDALKLLIECGMLVHTAGKKPYNRFRNRIMFPIQNRRGRIVGFGGRALSDDNPKYLNSPETPWFHKGNELYGLHAAQQSVRTEGYIMVVEGYMDVLALAQYHITNVAATLGTAATSEHIRRLLRYTQHIIFCFDGDRAGGQAAWRALENCLPFIHDGIQVAFLFLPEDEDPDSLIRKEREEGFKKRINAAMPLSNFFMQHLAAQVDLRSIDGKTRFAELAKPLIKQINDGVYKELLLQQMAQVIRIDKEKLQQLLSSQNKNPEPKAIKSSTPQGLSPIRQAITLLLQNPELAQHCGDLAWANTIKIPGIELLLSMVEIIQRHPQINTASLLEHYNDHPHKQVLQKLAIRQLYIPENGLKAEFMDILKRLQQLSLEQQMEALLSKANISGLSPSEREQLNQLLQQKQETIDQC